MVLKLCEELTGYRRPLVVLGGSAHMWGYDEPYDEFVQKTLIICQSQGIPAIDGVDFLSCIPRVPGDVYHIQNTRGANTGR